MVDVWFPAFEINRLFSRLFDGDETVAKIAEKAAEHAVVGKQHDYVLGEKASEERVS